MLQDCLMILGIVLETLWVREELLKFDLHIACFDMYKVQIYPMHMHIFTYVSIHI